MPLLLIFFCENNVKKKLFENFSIRGRLSSFLYLSRNIGILFSYVIGSFIQYKYLPCICVLIQVIYAAIFIFLPNTPKFHLERHEIQVRL